jgi:hypothetical protein
LKTELINKQFWFSDPNLHKINSEKLYISYCFARLQQYWIKVRLLNHYLQVNGSRMTDAQLADAGITIRHLVKTEDGAVYRWVNQEDGVLPIARVRFESTSKIPNDFEFFCTVCMGTHVHSAIDGYVSIYKRKELIGYLQN